MAFFRFFAERNMLAYVITVMVLLPILWPLQAV